MQSYLLAIVQLLFRAVFILIIARAVMSWFRPSSYSRTYYDLDRFIRMWTEPILRPLRRLLPSTGGIDWSPVIALILLGVVESAVVMMLVRL